MNVFAEERSFDSHFVWKISIDDACQLCENSREGEVGVCDFVKVNHSMCDKTGMISVNGYHTITHIVSARVNAEYNRFVVHSVELLMVATCATASMAAVSVRRRDEPSEIGWALFSMASEISSVEKSPSGPMRIVVAECGFRTSNRYDFCPSAQWAMNTPESLVESLAKGVNGLRMGRRACLLCFAAEIMILLRRSVLTVFRSENRQSRGVISSTPISTAFSINHSKRSMFFVGATAIWR